jgi:orotate phosphoribosyltransferase
MSATSTTAATATSTAHSTTATTATTESTATSATQEVQSLYGIPVWSIACLDDLLGFLQTGDASMAGQADHAEAITAYRARYGIRG